MSRHHAALPFVLKRAEDVVGPNEIRSTSETIHGLVRLEPDRLVVQWRLSRATDRVGREIRQDLEVLPVQEVEIPLASVARAFVRRRWWDLRPQLVLVGDDLRAFEALAGQEALRSSHPAEIVLNLRRRDRVAGLEFAADVTLAAVEWAAGERHDRLRPPGHAGAPEPLPGERLDPESVRPESTSRQKVR